MKQIELTEKQIWKINVMCTKLFPKYDCVLRRFSTVTYLISWGLKTKDLYEGHTPWFEFSWKILNKILEESKKTPLQITKEIELYGIICFNDFFSQHPVDYLYEKFKEIKK